MKTIKSVVVVCEKCRCYLQGMSLGLLLKACRAFSPTIDPLRPRLVTVGFSHFCEKARWALELSPINEGYYEDIHCPALHFSSSLDLVTIPRVYTWEEDVHFQRTLKLRHAPKIAGRKEKTSIPKLVLPQSFLQMHKGIKFKSELDHFGSLSENKNAVVSNGSSGILKLLSDVYPAELGHLYPKGDIGAQIVELENKLDTGLGGAATSWAFGNLLLSGTKFYRGEIISKHFRSANNNMVSFFAGSNSRQSVPVVEKVIWRLFGKRYIIPLMCKANGVSAEATDIAEADIHQVFREMDALLEAHNPSGDKSTFLLGAKQISAADIAFASLAAPIVMPQQTDKLFMSIPELESLCKLPNTEGAVRMLQLAQDVRRTYKSAQYLLHLYEHHRFRGLQNPFVTPRLK